jgi:hypothetical protein
MMKKILIGIVSLAVLAFATPARADYLDFVSYNSTTAAADAAIDTGKIVTAGADEVVFWFKNAGSQARTAAVECWDPGQNTTTFRTTLSVAATGGFAQVVMDSHASAATAPTGVTLLAMKPCHVVSVTAAAATGTMRTSIVQRRQRFTSTPNPPKQ